MNYVVISPVKNEERYIEQTILSMVSQKIPPLLWVIVDDASTDGTAGIIKEWEKKCPWLFYLLYPGEAIRKTGSAEIHAFNYGFETLQSLSYDFIVKLDGDLRFDENYFETLLSQFANRETLGIASGVYLEESGPTWEPVAMPPYHAAGASKAIRRACFDDIGGFIPQRGWDTIDEIRAQAKGWQTMHFPEIRFYHLRKEGTGMGQLHTSVMHGEIFYRSGGSFHFFILKAFHRVLRGKPILLAGAAMIYGYLAAFFRRREMLVNALEARAYRRLLYGRLRGVFR